MILATHGIVGSSIVQVDADWLAYYNRVIAAGGSLSTTEQTASQKLVKDLKDYGIWSKMKAIYPMVGASAAACAQNLKSSSFTGTFNGGWTFASTGATPNGTNAYMNTNLVPDNSLTLNNTHLSIYSRTNVANNGVDIGTNDNAITFLPLFKMLLRSSGGNYLSYQYSFQSGQELAVSNTNSQGMYIASRISSTSHKAYKNSSNIATITTSNNQTRMSKFSLFLGASHNNGFPEEYSNRQNAFASIGDGITDTEASNLYTAVQAFQTTLSRQV
jgi:hypothetical protein